MLPELIQGIRAQSKLSISQAISLLENQHESGAEFLSLLHPFTGRAHKIGITGPPGAGKSSLTDNLITTFRKMEKRVAVIAVDPSSSFSGGAVLGDRIRMTSHHSDSQVFIRSMATRGGQGGLAIKTQEVGEIFDAAQFDIIIYETIGVGQIELDVIQATDTVIVVLVPESGDEVQMLKAGLMEIGNIFVINKADRPGANKLMITLKNFLSTLTIQDYTWLPQVIQTTAPENKGTTGLVELIQAHHTFNEKHGIQHQKLEERYKCRVMELIKNDLMQKFWNDSKHKQLQYELEMNHQDRRSPFNLANQLLTK